MSAALLKTYIRMLVEEKTCKTLGEEEEEMGECDSEETVNEFSAAGAVAGYTGPLGVDPDKLGRKKNTAK